MSYDLILWSSAKVGAFPRAHRFTVGDRLITRLMDPLALLASVQDGFERASFSTDESFARAFIAALRQALRR